MRELRLVTDLPLEQFILLRKRFESVHPDVMVTMESVSDPTRTKEKACSELPPDLIQLDMRDLMNGVKKGDVVDLLPYFQQDGMNFYQILPQGFIDILDVEGKLPAIPFQPLTYVIIYNKRRFDEANEPYPQEGWTWNDFLATAKKLTKTDEAGNMTQVGVYLPHGNLGQMERFILENGGSILSPDGHRAKGYIDDTKAVEAVKTYCSLFREHKVSPVAGNHPVLHHLNLAHERIAMFWEISKLVQWIRPQKLQDVMGVVGLPIGPFQDTPVNMVWMKGFGISSKSRNKQLAWEFLQHMISPEKEIAQAWTKSGIAHSNAVAEQSGQIHDPLWRACFKELDHVKKSAIHVNPSWDQIASQLNLARQLENMIEHGEDVQATLSRWADDIDKVLMDEYVNGD